MHFVSVKHGSAYISTIECATFNIDSEKLVFQSAVRFLILFVLVDAILLSLTLQERTLVKKSLKLPTPYIKNLGMCFAILVYFDFGYVCVHITYFDKCDHITR